MLLCLEFWASILRSVDVHWGGDFDRRQPQPREMIVVYLRLASGEKMANHILVVFCCVKYFGCVLLNKMDGPLGTPGDFAAANSERNATEGGIWEVESKRKI
jgi:hypothetical protein